MYKIQNINTKKELNIIFEYPIQAQYYIERRLADSIVFKIIKVKK